MVKEKLHQQELYKKLWNMANELRGNMNANEFKDYILGVIFYRYLSEKVEQRANYILKNDSMTYREAWKMKEIREPLTKALIEQRGYMIEPEYLFSTMIEEIEKGDSGKFDVEYLIEAINNITESTLGQDSQETFENLFDDMDLSSTKLGKTVKARSNLMAKILVLVNEISFTQDDTEIDILGDTYEYLIGKFAANAGQKAGEFYTPQGVSKVLAKIVTLEKEELKDVYDPTCGSGSLLLRVNKEAKVGKFYGQELNSTTFNLARMNMLLHEVHHSRFDIQNADTIEEPQHMGMEFEAVVANPPYSSKWSSDKKFEQDERFSGYGKLAPKSRADYVFVQHMIHHLADNGTMAVVLPHGVLFRGGAEENIRKYLIKGKNYLDAVIGLPENLFYGTGIPTVILVYKKCRREDDTILFIDASKGFQKVGNKNMLRQEDIEKIVNTYANREEIDKYSHNATLEEIEENDYNLNIPRYVDTFEPEPRIDIDEVKVRLNEIDKEISEIDEEIDKYLKELGL
ncbi:MAG: type I restriction-modification system subunit M [Clostridiaceae bacterium]|nr:type I restriction-modification system subunit M [Clostridiaceae bacterium]MBW4860451.1 type I restriction-modification system subunit M [Clostridiaceae bacterium]MBW4868367.1 type I restriction-modification system subunit M [Clostridiaceae bacterium]